MWSAPTCRRFPGRATGRAASATSRRRQSGDKSPHSKIPTAAEDSEALRGKRFAPSALSCGHPVVPFRFMVSPPATQKSEKRYSKSAKQKFGTHFQRHRVAPASSVDATASWSAAVLCRCRTASPPRKAPEDGAQNLAAARAVNAMAPTPQGRSIRRPKLAAKHARQRPDGAQMLRGFSLPPEVAKARQRFRALLRLFAANPPEVVAWLPCVLTARTARRSVPTCLGCNPPALATRRSQRVLPRSPRDRGTEFIARSQFFGTTASGRILPEICGFPSSLWFHDPVWYQALASGSIPK